ncbi:glycosyltransferase WbuB, partial [Stenotrophomonas sp. HMWF022]
VKARISDQGLGHRFLFLGRHPEADMPAFFACADAMLVSLRDEPIFALTVPSKVQAYMACGKPILASLKGEGAVIVSEASAGVVVPPSAPMPLAAAMDKVASLDEEDLRAMGRRSRQVYEQRYSLNAVTGKLVSHLEAVLAKASSGI